MNLINICMNKLEQKAFMKYFFLKTNVHIDLSFAYLFSLFSNFQIKQITFIFHQFYFTETVTFCFLKFNQMLFCWYWKTNRTLIFNSGNTKHIQKNTDTYNCHIQNPTIYISGKQEERERKKIFCIYLLCW